MAYPDLEKAREHHAALREIFIHHPGGWADKEALHKVEKLAWQAMTLMKDAEYQEKMGRSRARRTALARLFNAAGRLPVVIVLSHENFYGRRDCRSPCGLRR